MPKKPSPSTINQTAIGDGNVQVAGANNTVNVKQTFVQKVINIFKSDAETVDQRNRRIMLGHVENFWVKGILEKSLHGAALLELGIKEDPDALTYPWAIKREANKETLPAGTSMLEIFQEIGMGRSLLILGAPGSGKTTMLLELTRQLIEHAREDVTEPIPVVFNLSSWTEKLSLADWLARELNNIYYVPKKTAPTWVKENKMLLLLDGLDEVKQESRDKCVDAINQFRKENGLTSIAVCSRIQDYAELKTRLSFDGAIEIQPLRAEQVDEYFRRLGKSLAGIRKALEKDVILREMAETPLFLSTMTLTYRDKDASELVRFTNIEDYRVRLFNTYIEHMLDRPARAKYARFNKVQTLNALELLAQRMVQYNIIAFQIEAMQPAWLVTTFQRRFHQTLFGLTIVLIYVLIFTLIGGVEFGTSVGLTVGVIAASIAVILGQEIVMVDRLKWSWKESQESLMVGLAGLILGGLSGGLIGGVRGGLIGGIGIGMSAWTVVALMRGLSTEQVDETTYPGQRLWQTVRNTFFVLLLFGMLVGPSIGLIVGPIVGLSIGLIIGMVVSLNYGIATLIKHYTLRFVLAWGKLLPWQLVPFLDYAVDIIFMRQVGGSYIFVHRLLMEHFADMYAADEK